MVAHIDKGSHHNQQLYHQCDQQKTSNVWELFHPRLLYASFKNVYLALNKQNGTASVKSPPHLEKALITSGVMTELVATVISVGST